MLGFQSFQYARIVLGSIETICRIRKGQMLAHKGRSPSAAEQFYSLALYLSPASRLPHAAT